MLAQSLSVKTHGGVFTDSGRRGRGPHLAAAAAEGAAGGTSPQRLSPSPSPPSSPLRLSPSPSPSGAHLPSSVTAAFRAEAGAAAPAAAGGDAGRTGVAAGGAAPASAAGAAGGAAGDAVS